MRLKDGTETPLSLLQIISIAQDTAQRRRCALDGLPLENNKEPSQYLKQCASLQTVGNDSHLLSFVLAKAGTVAESGYLFPPCSIPIKIIIKSYHALQYGQSSGPKRPNPKCALLLFIKQLIPRPDASLPLAKCFFLRVQVIQCFG